RLTRALALLLALDDVDDQLLELLGTARLGLPVAERLDPVGHFGFARHHVEELAPHVDAHARIVGGSLGDAHGGHLEAIVLHVPPAPQLDADDELDRRERWDFVDEALGRKLDQAFGVLSHGLRPCGWDSRLRRSRCAQAQILCRCRSLRPITMRWISEVPAPIKRSGASRYRRSISNSFE